MAKGKFEKPRTTAAKAVVKQKKKTKSNSGAAIAAVAAIVVALALVAGLGIYGYGAKLQAGDRVFPNVRIYGQDIGGRTRSEAKMVIDQAVMDSQKASTLVVTLSNGHVLTFDPKEANVGLDGQAALEAVMAYGKDGSPINAFFTWLDSRSNPREISVEHAMDLNTDYIKGYIDEVAAETVIAPQPTQVEHDSASNILNVRIGQYGQALDANALYEAVTDAMYRGDFEPFSWDYQQVPYEILTLDQYYETLAKEPQDARYDEETHEILEAVPGFGFDLDAANARIAAAQPGSTFSIPLEERLPTLSKEELTNKMFGQKLESRSSDYNAGQVGRTENLRLACEAINGTILNPGEIFSFNDVVGERTAEKGYKPATIYADGGVSAESEGGGVCQVASTIYYATLHMEVEQVYREPHMYRVTYVPEGMDATVYWDSKLDYKFRNTLSNPIKIQANIDGGKVNITFWGVKENDNYVKMENKILQTIPYEVEEKVDESKPVGYRERTQSPYTGYKVEAYRTLYDKDGNVLDKSTVYSYYKPRNEVYTVGPAEPAPPPVEEPDWEDPDWDEDWDDEDWGDYWP